MNNIEKQLSEKFGKDDIKISFNNQQFDLQQTGKDFFSSKKDVQFFAFTGINIYPVSFNKQMEHSLASQIASDYYNANLGLLLPTHLISVSGARNTSQRNEDGAFNGVIYELGKNQIEQIEEEYGNIVAEA